MSLKQLERRVVWKFELNFCSFKLQQFAFKWEAEQRGGILQTTAGVL